MKIAKLFTLLLMSGIPFTVFAQENPDPNAIRIERLNYGGSGCPHGSVGKYLSSDRRAFTLTFDRYSVELGHRVAPAQMEKNCNLTVGLRAPRGWEFALFWVEFRGFADLDPNVVGEHRSNVRMLTAPWVPLSRLVLTGPFVDNYRRAGRIALSQAAHSSCGNDRTEDIQIETNVSIKSNRVGSVPASPDGQMTMDTADGDLQQNYGLAWSKCSEAGGGARPEGRNARILNCSSSQYRRTRCDAAAGAVLGVWMEHKYSQAPCRYGQEFGIGEGSIWVDRGCRADFKVVY